MSHIEQSRNGWYATLKVPEELREKVGKTKFKQTLKTTNRQRALELAPPIVAFWKAQLRKLAGETDAVFREALRWRDVLADVKEDGDLLYEMQSLMAEEAESVEEKRGHREAQRFADVALGQLTPSTLHLDEWKASLIHLAQKTQDQMAKDAQVLVDQFHALQDITPIAASKWVETLQQKGTTASSLKRMMSFWRSYWRYLEKVYAVPPKSFPFSVEWISKPKTKAGGDTWHPFAPEQVPPLWQAATDAGDLVLADLITLGAYSGARIEELCSLRTEEVSEASFNIVDAKTKAGIREVPIHTKLKPLVLRLKEESTDGYLLSGLTLNKYGDRSNAVGKRFGRLKTKLGHGEKQVFHSLRKTVVTLLENAGVTENLAADIVGHEKPRITYGLYSGGASLSNKAQALELVAYPV